ncbi:Zona pellucida sperm-binding protein 3 [Channa argus]|uniref:Zona pellucida sperm-binding protein 3 n=1 Tax=Channa argus TaxID=215402 RepID=A0A6G1QG48_CHAAH|nr:Zona pellucida sperm-binding protein 3 [Channa argus]KAK2891596.1 hypothetical protein Q8A73_017261 [Channa argus]
MGTAELFLCILVCRLITVESNQQDVMFSQDLPEFSENLMLPPLEGNFDFTPYDIILNSWQSQTPDFNLLAESPPIVAVPRVQVFCDDSKLILLVDKSSNGVVLTKEEIQLGDSCYSNRELPNHFVFTYTLDQCGTTPVMQSGLKMFTNSLRLNLRQLTLGWWQTPSTVHITCIPESPYDNRGVASRGLPETDESFSIKAMNPSWTSNAKSNVYKTDQVLNLQVSTKPRPNQQLFVQSCFFSASADPHIRPKHMVIMNKGCTANNAAQFVASDRAHVVNLVLNTTYPYAKLYIHCSVLTSDQGVTCGSKSCNYNMIHSRWEELGGDVEVCKCCSSKCKGLSVKHPSAGTKAIVSTGPLVFEATDIETSQGSEPEESVNIPMSYLKLDPSSDETENMIVYGTSISRSKFSSPPPGVVVVRSDPVARLILWQSREGQDAYYNQNMASQSEDSLTVELKSALQPSTTDQVSLMNPPTNIKGQSALKHPRSPWDLEVVTLVHGWLMPQELDSSVITGEFQRRKFGGFRKFGTEAPQVTLHLSDDLNEKDPNDFNHFREEMTQMQADAPVRPPEVTIDPQPIIRSKIQFSKGVDGSQTLSYEEQVVGGHEGKGVIRRCGMDRIKTNRSAQKGVYSSFLDLLRTMDKAE